MRIALCTTILTCALATAVLAGPPEIKTEEDKTLYAIGLALSRNLTGFKLTEAEVAIVEVGLADGALNHSPQADLSAYMPKIQELQKARLAAASGGEKKVGAEFLAKAAQEKGAKKTDSGLVYTELKAGSGESPKPTDKVKVNYRGTLTDGKEFDSSYKRGEPATFGLNQVIKCWTEGVALMKPGGKAKLVCPSDIAYGDRGQPPDIRPGATLVFEVELLSIEK